MLFRYPPSVGLVCLSLAGLVLFTDASRPIGRDDTSPSPSLTSPSAPPVGGTPASAQSGSSPASGSFTGTSAGSQSLLDHSTASSASTGGDGFITGHATPTSGSTPDQVFGNSTGGGVNSTLLCNGYAEYCDRKWSNITMVGMHNSPFVKKNNVAANQELTVEYQLNDGARFLQAQMHWPSSATHGEPHFCHTSCDILDAGPISEWLTTVRQWVDKHPYDVVTVLLENGNMSSPDLYIDAIKKSRIDEYAYKPPTRYMTKASWPTLRQLLSANKRVILFLDYKADEFEYPWLIDQFSNIWETPMDPTHDTFPCTPERPDRISYYEANNGQRAYLMNHNYNAKITLASFELAIPAVSRSEDVNSLTGRLSVAKAANNCITHWGSPPLILNVDYYNRGRPEGSVFMAAAQLNGVTYTGRCCGTVDSTIAGFQGSSLAWSPIRIGVTVGGGVAVMLAILLLFHYTEMPPPTSLKLENKDDRDAHKVQFTATVIHYP